MPKQEELEKTLMRAGGVSLPTHKGHIQVTNENGEVHTQRMDLLTDLAACQLCAGSYVQTPTHSTSIQCISLLEFP